jgi:hypothetical protein
MNLHGLLYREKRDKTATYEAIMGMITLNSVVQKEGLIKVVGWVYLPAFKSTSAYGCG